MRLLGSSTPREERAETTVFDRLSDYRRNGRRLSILAFAVSLGVAMSPKRIYRRLLRVRGRAGWWPGESAFEVCVGAILVQNTAWPNADRALRALKERGMLSYEGLRGATAGEIAPVIRSSGTFNVKARRVAAFVDFLGRRYLGRAESMAREEPWELRRHLLAVPGIGPETADCIALYAAGHPLFVVDGYTRRVFSRLGLIH